MKHVTGCVAVIAALGATAALAGCGGSDEASTASTEGASSTAATVASTTGAEPSEAAKIAFLVSTYTPYQRAQGNGMKAAIGPEGKVEYFNSNYDTQKQFNQCRDAITSNRFNVIAIQQGEPGTSALPCVNAAKAAGIPVLASGLAIGRDVDKVEPQIPGVVGSFTFSPKAAADTYVELLRQACEGLDPCNVIADVASLTDGFTNATFDQAAKEMPNFKLVNKLVTAYDPAKVSSDLPQVLSAHPETDVFAGSYDASARAAAAVVASRGLQDKVKVLGSGADKNSVKSISSGQVFGSTGDYPFSGGEVLGKMAQQAVNGQPVDPVGVEAHDVGDLDVITTENIHEYKPEY